MRTIIAAVLAFAAVLCLGGVLLTRSDWYQIKRLAADGPTAAAAVRGPDGWEALAVWARALGRVGNEKDALSVARRVPAGLRANPASFTATVLSKAALGLSEAGKAQEAREASDEALTAAQTIPPEEIRYQIGALEDAAKVWAWAGKTSESKTLLARALTAARRIRDNNQQSAEVAEVAQAMAEAGDLDDARRVCKKILTAAPATLSDPYTQGFHLRRVAEALAQAGDFEDALGVSRQIDQGYGHKSPRYARLYGIEATSFVAQKLSSVGETDQAKKVWDEARTQARHVEDANSRSTALAIVASTLVRRGNVGEAKALLKEALASTGLPGDASSGSLDLSEVATALTEAGQVDDAITIARRSGYRVETLSRVAEALGRAGNDSQAKTVWIEARDAAFRDNNPERSAELMSVARAGARLHRYREARLAAESCPPVQRLHAYADILAEYAKENNLFVRALPETDQ